MNTCSRCDRDLATITEDNPCLDCGYIHDPTEPDVFEELNFNTDRERVYEPDFSDEDYVHPNPLSHVDTITTSTLSEVYDNVHNLEELANE